MKKITLSIVLFIAFICSISVVTVYSANTNKEDLQKVITWMYDNGLTSKSTVADFLPNDTLNREQASKFFSVFAKKIYNKTKVLSDSCGFSDIQKADKTLTSNIKAVCDLEIMK